MVNFSVRAAHTAEIDRFLEVAFAHGILWQSGETTGYKGYQRHTGSIQIQVTVGRGGERL